MKIGEALIGLILLFSLAAVSVETSAHNNHADHLAIETAGPVSVKTVRHGQIGTASHIGGGYFLTAAHVVTMDKPVATITVGGHAAYVVKKGTRSKTYTNDWAILRLKDKVTGVPTLGVACKPLTLGQSLRSFGWPHGVPAFSRYVYFGRSPQGTLFLSPLGGYGGGASGSAILNDDGDLVGIVVAGRSSGDITHNNGGTQIEYAAIVVALPITAVPGMCP